MPKFAVVFELIASDAVIPKRATPGAAGYDLRAYLRGRVITEYSAAGKMKTRECIGERYVIAAGSRVLIPLGFRTELPLGFEAQIRARSSIAVQRGLVIPNAPATIDSDYRDEWLLPLLNLSSQSVEVEHQERLAQVLFAAVESPVWEEGKLTRTTRMGGIGSTGRE